MIAISASAVLTLALLFPTTAPGSEPRWLADHLPRQYAGSLKLSSDRPGDIDLRIDSVAADGARVVFAGYIDVVNNTFRIPLEGWIEPPTGAVEICAHRSGEHSGILTGCLAGSISSDLRTIKARRGQGTSRILLNVVAD